MAPAIPTAELRLSYPLYALDFDPQDADRLLVGGGGGAARSGVGNKVSVLDVSRDDSLQIVSEIELSRDEDSVNTLAVGPRRNNSVLFYTGINSAEADLKKGKNEHFRVFSADLPSKTKGEADSPKIAELSRTALFSTSDPEAYQRLLRISDQVGAVATGTTGRSKDAQIAIFDVPSAASNKPVPASRGAVELVKEAMDMDMLQISDDEHQLVYCDDYDMYTLNIGKTDTTGPHSVFTMPHDQASGPRPSFRCIRYLTPTFVLAVANLPKAGGAVLQGFRLPKPADLGKEGKEGKARLALAVKLPKSVARATGLAVRNLSPPPALSAKQGDTQFVVAVTGQDGSISLFTLEHQTIAKVNLITKLHPVTTFKEVHLGPISGLAFSPFTPPTTKPSTPPTLKLASIGSMANTCIIHTLPLKPHPTPSQPQSESESQQQRYVLALKSAPPSNTTLLVGFALVFALIAILLQGALEIKGLAHPMVGARKVVPERWQSPPWYEQGRVVYLDRRKAETGSGSGSEQKAETEGQVGEEYVPVTGAGEGGSGGESMFGAYRAMHDRVVVLDAEEAGEEGVKVEGHDEERHGEAKGWEEMHPSQREAWKARLKKAGHWGEEMGEAVFKGVFFGEIAGVVGAMVR